MTRQGGIAGPRYGCAQGGMGWSGEGGVKKVGSLRGRPEHRFIKCRILFKSSSSSSKAYAVQLSPLLTGVCWRLLTCEVECADSEPLQRAAQLCDKGGGVKVGVVTSQLTAHALDVCGGTSTLNTGATTQQQIKNVGSNKHG
jgi:hypothetical protein